MWCCCVWQKTALLLSGGLVDISNRKPLMHQTVVCKELPIVWSMSPETESVSYIGWVGSCQLVYSVVISWESVKGIGGSVLLEFIPTGVALFMTQHYGNWPCDLLAKIQCALSLILQSGEGSLIFLPVSWSDMLSALPCSCFFLKYLFPALWICFVWSSFFACLLWDSICKGPF